MRRHYSPALKAKVVRERILETRPVTAIGSEYGIVPRLLHRWREEVVDHLQGLSADPAPVQRETAPQDAKVEDLCAPVREVGISSSVPPCHRAKLPASLIGSPSFKQSGDSPGCGGSAEFGGSRRLTPLGPGPDLSFRTSPVPA